MHDPAHHEAIGQLLACGEGAGALRCSMMDPLTELSTSIAGHTGSAATATWQNKDLGLTLIAVHGKAEPQHQVYEPVFAIVAAGQKEIVLGEKVFRGKPGSFMIVSVELPITFQITEASRAQPYVALALRLRPAAVASLLLEAAAAETSPGEVAGMGICMASRDLVENVVRLVRLLDQPRDLPVLWPITEKELLWRLLCSDQGYRLRQVGLADSRLSQIGRAMRWMRENYSEAVSIDDLARVAAMSVTSFHRHFRAVALMSPLQYHKQIRLQEARARLLGSAQDVAAIGQAVGYDSASQFSREYKRAYGSPPGQDARLLRASHGKS